MIRYLHQQAFDARPELKNCWSMRIKRQLKRTSSAPIPVSSPGFNPPAGPSGSRTRSFTTCTTTRSAGCASTFPWACWSNYSPPE
jgi:hypothetical protein